MVSRDQALDWIVEAHRAFARYAADRGVWIVVTPVNRCQEYFIQTNCNGLALLNLVGYPNVGLMLDTLNIKDPSITRAPRDVGDWPFRILIADSTGTDAWGGHIDFARVRSTQSEMSHTGYLMGEFMAHPDSYTAAQRNIEHLRPSLDQITL